MSGSVATPLPAHHAATIVQSHGRSEMPVPILRYTNPPGSFKSMLEYALAYRRAGWSVIPLHAITKGRCTCKKDDCPHPGKHPRVSWKAYQAGLPSEYDIMGWWGRWPKANIGIITGRVSGIIALDVDGEEGLETLRQHGYNHLPPTAVSRTGRGWHYIFRHPGGDCRNFAGKTGQTILPHVDFRGDGGFIVVEPSHHVSGRTYRWEVTPEEAGIADPPEWLVQLIRRQASQHSEDVHRRLTADDWSVDVPEGARNVELTRRAGALLAGGRMEPAEALVMLLAWNERHCKPPLPEAEVRAIVASIAKAESRKQTTQANRQAVKADVPQTTASGKPVIEVSFRFLREIAKDALSALHQANDPPTLFRRGGTWVRVPPGAVRAEALTPAALKGVLDRVADFVKVTERGYAPTRPPADLPPDLLALPDPGLPELQAIATTPVCLPDGRLLTTDGYDPRSGLLLRLRGLGAVRHDMPVEEALGWLFGELLADFPYTDDAGRAHTLAAMLERFVRPMIDGPTPIFLIDAPAQGTGKGLLAEVIGIVTTGEPARVMALPPSEEEVEKRITTVLLEAPPIILLDNVVALRSTSLAAVITATIWRGRKLGESRLLELPNTSTWLATGNNVELSHELARRAIPIRLDAGMERPEERSGFLHDNLTAWTRDHRTELVSACLSLVQRWLDAGRPAGDRTLGRFEAWARTLGGILKVAGVPGFLEGREKLYATADHDSQDWTAACSAWWETYGPRPVTAGDLFPLLKERELLMDLWAARSHTAALQRIGHALARNRDRVFGQWCIRMAGREARTHSQSYRLERREKEAGQKTPQTTETKNIPASDGLAPRGFLSETPAVEAKTPAAKTPAVEAKPRKNPRDENALQERVSGSRAGVWGVWGVLFPAQPSGSDGLDREVIEVGPVDPP